MKPTVFVGSSIEGKDVALSLFRNLEKLQVRPTHWTNSLFLAGASTLPTLEKIARDFNFAVLVATPDDVLEKRGETAPTLRDNVLFELGLFIGAIGSQRAFLALPKGLSMHLPSDLLGVTCVEFDFERFVSGRKSGNQSELAASTQTCASDLAAAIDAPSKDFRLLALAGRWVITEALQAIGPEGKPLSMEGDFHISVRGSAITGVGMLTALIAGQQKKLDFEFNGILTDHRFVRLDAHVLDLSVIDFFYFLFELSPLGNELQGGYVSYGAYSKRVVTTELHLRKAE